MELRAVTVEKVVLAENRSKMSDRKCTTASKTMGQFRMDNSGKPVRSRMVKNLKHFEKAWFPVS